VYELWQTDRQTEEHRHRLNR